MSFRYIDTHVHFWDRARLSYPWLETLPQISAPHLPETYQAETAVTPPEKIVFVQCIGDLHRWEEEVTWIEELAQIDPRISGIVASAPINEGDATLRILDGLTQHPLVKAVRHNMQDEEIGHSIRPEFVAGVAACGERGLTFDLCCYHPQLPDLVELVSRCPHTRFVLDHLGKPGIRDHVIDPWRQHISQLAAQPNVDAKLSGIVTESDVENWTIEDLRPYVSHYLSAFGVDRVLFGSDWPVVKLASTHARWLATARELTAHLLPENQDKVFFQNAARAYRLGG